MSLEQQPSVPSFIAAAKIESGNESNLPAAIDASSFVVASYNIRYAVGQFLISSGLLRKAGLNPPQPRFQRVAENIELAAKAFSGSLLPHVDILALQEADKGTTRTGGHHVARDLAEKLGMAWVHVAAGIPRGIPPAPRQWWLNFEEQIGLHDEGDTGVALLSRVTMQDVVRIDLPWHECPWRPRLAMAATVTVGSQSLRLINAHVDPHAALGGQLEQLEVLVNHAKQFAGPTLILGDFNTLTRHKALETRHYLESQGFATFFRTGTPTWRGFGLRLHADWIFSRGVEIKQWGVAQPLNVSDHWPIWAEITLPIGNCQLPI